MVNAAAQTAIDMEFAATRRPADLQRGEHVRIVLQRGQRDGAHIGAGRPALQRIEVAHHHIGPAGQLLAQVVGAHAVGDGDIAYRLLIQPAFLERRTARRWQAVVETLGERAGVAMAGLVGMFARLVARAQFEHPQRLAYVQSEEYQELMANNRIYEQASHDLITNKNRLHKAIQLTFPEIEHLMVNPRGKNYWSIVLRFPHPDIVLETKEADIIDFLKGLSGIGKKRANDITQSLIRLAKVACPAVKKNSAHVRGLKMAINNILSAEEECQTALQEMAKLAPKRDLEILTSIPGIGENTALRIISELGDIRRFNNPSQLNAFVGVDPQVYESGNLTAHLSISKRGTAIGRKVLYLAINQIQSAKKAGNPCHIADYYEKRKRSSETASHKKAAIASIHKLLRTIFALITNDQLYSYDVAKHNQRLLS